MTMRGAGDRGTRRVGIRFFIRCIYCSIIGSVARDNGHSLPTHLRCASANPAV